MNIEKENEAAALTLHEIRRPDDPELVAFARLLQTLFPLEEQVLMAEVIELVQRKGAGEKERHHLLTGRVGETTCAMAWYERSFGSLTGEVEGDIPVAVLWYIGIDGAAQGKGLGSVLYQEIARRAFSAGCRALLMEVERVDVSARESAERAEQARRRLRFYQDRHGARVVCGIEYVMSTGWQPPLAMHLLVQWADLEHPVTEDGEELFSLLRSVFGAESVTRASADARVTLERFVD